MTRMTEEMAAEMPLEVALVFLITIIEVTRSDTDDPVARIDIHQTIGGIPR